MTATWPEAMSRLTRACGLADSSRVVLSGAGGYVPEEALILGDGFAFTNTGPAPNQAAFFGGLVSTRAGLSAAVQNIQGETDAALGELALILGYSGLSGASAIPWVYQAMATNSPVVSTGPSYVPSRQITRGSPSTSGTGNGVLTRLAIDRYGFPTESDTPEPILMTCRQDVTLGTNPGQESFDFFAAGAPAGDVFQIWTAGYGDGVQAPAGAVIGVTADTSASMGIQNPSFNQSSGSGSSFVLNGWNLTAGSAGALSVSTLPADIYRAAAIEGTTPGALLVSYVTVQVTAVTVGSNGVNVSTFAGAGVLNATNPIAAGFPSAGTITVNTGSGYVTLTYTGTSTTQFTGVNSSGATGVLATGGYIGLNQTITISQTLATNGGALSAVRAYFSRLACNRSNYTGVGTVTVQIGSRSWSLFLGTQTGYQPLSPPLSSATDATNGPNLWFPNFDANNFAVTITISLGLGGILVDDFDWGPFTSVAGKLQWLGGGSTNFLYGDTVTFTDSETLNPINGVVNHWISRLYPPWNLPAKILPITPPTAPTAAVSGSGGVVTAGAHYYAVAFFNNSTGVEGAPGPVSIVLVSDGTKQVNLTAVPTSGALFRKIYMTQAAGNPLSLYFVGSIADNSTTTFAVNVADAALTLVSPATADPP